MIKAQTTFIRKTMATRTCKMMALFLNVIRSYMMPDTVGPQKLPRAKEDVNNPETTACTSMLSGNPASIAATWADPKLATRRAEEPKPWRTREPLTLAKDASKNGK